MNAEESNKYDVVLEDKFQEELQDCLDYISYVLFSPQAANILKNKSYELIDSLQFFPRLFQEYNDTCYRRIVVKKYSIFYLIDEENKVVKVKHFK